jgi:hypothetical protein
VRRERDLALRVDELVDELLAGLGVVVVADHDLDGGEDDLVPVAVVDAALDVLEEVKDLGHLPPAGDLADGVDVDGRHRQPELLHQPERQLVVVAPQQLPRHLRLHIPHTHTAHTAHMHIPHIPHTMKA